MTTLWPIPKEAREELENGNHVLLQDGSPRDGGVVIAFEEDVKDCFTLCDWKLDDGWE